MKLTQMFYLTIWAITASIGLALASSLPIGTIKVDSAALDPDHIRSFAVSLLPQLSYSSLDQMLPLGSRFAHFFPEKAFLVTVVGNDAWYSAPVSDSFGYEQILRIQATEKSDALFFMGIQATVRKYASADVNDDPDGTFKIVNIDVTAWD